MAPEEVSHGFSSSTNSGGDLVVQPSGEGLLFIAGGMRDTIDHPESLRTALRATTFTAPGTLIDFILPLGPSQKAHQHTPFRMHATMGFL